MTFFPLSVQQVYTFFSMHALGAVLLLVTSCDNGKPVKKTTPTLTERLNNIDIPVFNADSAYHYVERQVQFGPRVPNTQAHALCAVYLTSQMNRFADTVYLQQFRARAFDGTILQLTNIIGVFNPQKSTRLLLCAHWDTRPFADHDPDPANHNKPVPGANDGGSGVGVLLEVARQLALRKPEIGVDIIFFDGEDYGEPQHMHSTNQDSWALGSQHWSRNPHIRNYIARFGILLDMVGAADALFTMEGTSMQYAPDIMKKVWDIAHALGHSAYFSRNRTNPIVDDHLYINQIIGIPTIDIIHYSPNTPSGFFEYWHTINDDMPVIDHTTLQMVGETVLAVVFLENSL